MSATVAARERRGIYLEMIKCRVRPGSGSSLEFLRTRGWKAVGMDLTDLKTPWVVVGGVATRLYMPMRLTEDLDILVRGSDFDAFERELADLGGRRVCSPAFGGAEWTLSHLGRLDILVSTEPWVDDAVNSPNRAPDGMPVIALPCLVLLKADASRGQDLADIGRMLGQADETSLGLVREAIRRWRPADLDDIESLITIGRLEYEPRADS